MSEHVLASLPPFGRIPVIPSARNAGRRLVMPLRELMGRYGAGKCVECPKHCSEGG